MAREKRLANLIGLSRDPPTTIEGQEITTEEAIGYTAMGEFLEIRTKTTQSMRNSRYIR